jgi:hypothetical protein
MGMVCMRNTRPQHGQGGINMKLQHVSGPDVFGLLSTDVCTECYPLFSLVAGDPLGQLEGDGYKVRITRPGAQSPLTTEPPVVLVYDTSHPLVQESSTPPDSLP